MKKGYKMTEEVKNKISKNRKGIKAWNKGIPGPKADKSPNWKGGISNTSSKRWANKNKEYFRKYNSEYKKKKREFVNQLNANRRALLLGATGSHDVGEWETLKAQYDWKCLKCFKREPDITLTRDHIIPLSKGGSNNIENIQPLCRNCNAEKHVKCDDYRKIYE